MKLPLLVTLIGGGVAGPDITAPTITSSAAISLAENDVLSHTLVADEAVTWTKTGGADTALFTLIAPDNLTMAAKDFETPTDADANNTYVVQVTATDAALNATNQTITVTVTDVQETAVVTLVDSAVDATDATVYTFTGKALGAAAADRLIIVTGGYRCVGTPTISSITIGGVTATNAITTRNTANQLTANFIYYAVVPTGTTGDVVVTLSGSGAVNCGISLYRTTTYNSVTPYQTGTATRTSTVGTMSPSLAAQVYSGFVIGSAYAAGGTNRRLSSGKAVTTPAASLTITVDCQDNAPSWTTGITEDVDNVIESGALAVMAASSAAWAFPAIPATGSIYAFAITGQSNAEGRGTSGPVVPTGNSSLYNGVSYANLVDPVGGAQTGSAWPAFANEWTLLSTTQKTVFRELATGGTSVMTLETPNWSTTGTLLPAAVTAFNAMMTNLAAVPGVTLAGGSWLWLEGETAARMIFDGDTTGAAYETALGASLQYAKDNCPSLSYIFISELGPASSGKSAAYTAVRTAQANVAAAKSSFVKIVYTNAKNFTYPATMKSDILHYNQTGLDLVGVGMADGAYAILHP